MKVNMVFQSNSVPVEFIDVVDVYTKDGLLCLLFKDRIIKFPLVNVFSIESDYKKEGA